MHWHYVIDVINIMHPVMSNIEIVGLETSYSSWELLSADTMSSFASDSFINFNLQCYCQALCNFTFIVGLMKLLSACSGYACYSLQKENSRVEMNGKHMQLSIQNPFCTLLCVQEAILILRYITTFDLFTFWFLVWNISHKTNKIFGTKQISFNSKNWLRLNFRFKKQK